MAEPALAEGFDAAELEMQQQGVVIGAQQTQDEQASAVPESKFRRQVMSARKPPELPRPADAGAYEALSPGTKFIDPEGNTRAKPYAPKGVADYREIPEGADFVDPQGQLRIKPKYEPVDFTAQTLYDMAVNDKERKKALERSYPGKVKVEPGTNDLYVDNDGKLHKPKGFTEAPGAFMTAIAAPTIGSIFGEIGGGLAASAVAPGVGTVGGAFVGGGLGGMAGQGFNDLIMQLAGTYDRSGNEEAEELGKAGAAGAVGAAAGRGIAAVAPSIKGFLQTGASKSVGHFLGADVNGGEGLRTGIALREKGAELVPLSQMFPEAPHLANISEVLDPAFRTQRPIMQAAKKYYEKTGAEILTSLGAKTEGSLINPTAAPSLEEAGMAVKTKVLAQSQAADKELTEALLVARGEAGVKALQRTGTEQSSLSELQKAAQTSREAANKVIDTTFGELQQSVNEAMQVAKAGHNSGDLWWRVGEQLKSIRQGIASRAKLQYNQASDLAGNARPDVTGLSDIADDFLQQMPEGFQNKYPGIVKQIRDLVGVIDEQGQIVKEAAEPTFGQLHELRTSLRTNVNWHDLTPSVHDGVYKFFQARVNEALHVEAGLDTPLGMAARLLDETDKWYGEALGPLKSRNIQAIMDGLESGLPADPQVLYTTLIKEGRSEQINKISEMVGPNLWGAVKAADIQAMLDASKSLIPGQVDGHKFAQEVLGRHRDNMLEAVHGKTVTQKLLQQARDIEALDGRLDINTLPADTLSDVVRKAKQAGDAAEVAAKQDPLKTLGQEMRNINVEHGERVKKIQLERKQDPFNFLRNPTVGATQAAKRILDSEDLLIAAAKRFGETSPEFQLLRQAWAMRVLRGTMDPSTQLAKVSNEVQALMVPGVTLDQMQMLAKEMVFFLGSKGAKEAGKSIMATAAVEHPATRVIGKGGSFLPKIPIADAGFRFVLGKYYKFVTEMGNKLWFLRWVERGLKGDPIAQARSREALQQAMQRGGAIGAGVGEAGFQTPNGQ